MMISLSACKQAQPLVNFPGSLINMDQLILPRQRRKDKVVVVLGSTGTGKSRLSIDLATRLDAEIINSDKMQVYKGLNIVTNKVTDEECLGVPHHLLGFVDPEADFEAHDFVHHASIATYEITKRGRLPIIAGGSNSCIKALVNDDIEFRSKYECCFLWVDVSMPILHSFVSKRVDQMVDLGLVEEAKEFFELGGDYTKGIRRSIGVPEMDEYFRYESSVDDEIKAKLLDRAIDEIKDNTCKLACRQRQNILRLREQLERRIHRLDATEALLRRGNTYKAEKAWERLVAGPSTKIVGRFLLEDHIDFVSSMATAPTTTLATTPLIFGPTNTSVAVATATR